MLANRQCSVPTGNSVVGVAVVPYTSAVHAIAVKEEVVETWTRYRAAPGIAAHVNSGLAVTVAPAAGVLGIGGSRLSARAGAPAANNASTRIAMRPLDRDTP